MVAGGQFSSANGQPVTAVVALDRTTGATDTSFNLTIENRITNGSVLVRTLARKDSSLFIGGALTHVSSRGGAASYQRGAAQVDAATGAPVTSWNPEFNGTVVSVDPTPDRLYAAGYFTTSRGQTAMKAAAVLRQPNSPLATPQWSPVWSSSERSNYQQAIKATTNRVWVGGSEHSMFSFDTTTFARTSTGISNAGGDLQTISIADGVAYGGCHCNNYQYSDATTWPGLAGWTQADKIGWIGAWDAATGEFLPEFSPIINSDKGAGSWSSMVDSKGTLWTGGDYRSVRTGVSSSSWAGGFVRFPQVDSTAPATPGGVVVSAPAGDTVRVAWSGSSGATSYEVLRDDRVVAVTGATAVDVPLGGGNRFFVRAVDAAGNRSASSRVAVPADPNRNPLVLPYGSQWAYRNDASAAPADWTAAGFDDSSWRRGPGMFGFGSEAVVTSTDNPAGSSARAVTSYFRRTLTIPDVDQVKNLTLTTWADDGVAVYVNGKEVGRKNLGSSTISYSRYADAAPRTATAQAEPLQIQLADADVPDSGPLTIAAEVHLNYKGTRDSSFDLRATATYYTDSDPKPAPPAEADPVQEPEPEPDPVDPAPEPVDPEPVDPAPVDPAPEAEPEPVQQPVLAAGQQWAYRTEASAPAAGWSASSFDDSGWSRGKAVLGFGSADLGTDIDNPAGSSARAVTSYFRKTVELADRDGLQSLTLTTWADDGVAVYVDGVEVGRKNLGTGSLSYGRYADSAVRTSAAQAAPLTIEIPAADLPDGPLTIAAEVHVNYRATKDLSFDLTAEATYEGEQ
ncbi:hypothetical protein GC722_04550 [Auraticoccus sp. F435]|uniref:Fibronectin type-III domain-containing protein n=1 Tax=Auraticoccus cholistanensis TaxID=2656650 RepID=A0A6A9URK0_9ACTN|nr:hypothetical protein [Auraticoccus cholistanensis]